MTAGSQSERSEKAARIRREVDASLDRLAVALEAGNSEQLERFLSAMGRFHRYSFQNLMLILSQRPDATRVAGFQTWRSLGRAVKKGEKGIAIFAPMRIRKKSEELPKPATGTPSSAETDDPSFLRFRVVHVFDLTQTEGEPLPEPARVAGDPAGAVSALKAVIADRGIELVEGADLGGADGVSTGGCIKVRRGLAPAEMFAVLVHELAHELLHKVEERPSKTVRETEAEAVAHVVCESIGLAVGSAAADYIKLYSGERETLTASLTRIQKTACTIIDAVHERLEADRGSRPVQQALPASPGPKFDPKPDTKPEPEEYVGDIGAVSESYSGDRIGMHGRIRRPFRWRGDDWVCVGQGPGAVFEAYRLEDPGAFTGPTTTYSEKTQDAAVARADPEGFYHGMLVRHGQRHWVLCGPPVRLVAASSLLPMKERPANHASAVQASVQLGLFENTRGR